MYVIKSDLNSLPFAVIKDFKDSKDVKALKLAITEEFSTVAIILGCFRLPDWGTAENIPFTGMDENNNIISGSIEITKVTGY